MIIREKYLSKIRPFYDKDIIKVITGIRRSGKSTLLKQIIGAYNGVADNYPKYVLTMDKFDFSQNGIIHKNVVDWLLEDE